MLAYLAEKIKGKARKRVGRTQKSV